MLKKSRNLVVALLIPTMIAITPFYAYAWLLDANSTTYTKTASVTAAGTADTGNPDGNYIWFGKTYSTGWVGESGTVISGSRYVLGSLWNFDHITVRPPTNPGTWSLSGTTGVPPMPAADHYATADPSANYPSWATRLANSPAKTVTP